MDIGAAIMLGIAILIGVIMLSYLLQDKEIPKGLPILHGSAAGIGVILLVIYALTSESEHQHWDSIVIFLVAILGGLFLFEKDITHQKVPKSIAVIHALIALGGFGWLVYHLLK